MKTNDLKQIIQTTWRFFRITGQLFAKCLKKAWTNFKLVAAMCTRIVKFYFLKVDGVISAGYSRKTADRIGWENLKKLEIQDRISMLKGDRNERQEYRCFKKLNLVS